MSDFDKAVVAAMLKAREIGVQMLASDCEAILQAAKQSMQGEAVATIDSFTNGSYYRNYKITFHQDVDVGTKLYTHAPDSAARIAEQDAEIARLTKELDEARKKAARYDWIEKQANRGATNCGQVFNQNLLNGHRHKNRLMYSFLIRADNASESVDMPLSEAIDAAISKIGGAE